MLETTIDCCQAQLAGRQRVVLLLVGGLGILLAGCRQADGDPPVSEKPPAQVEGSLAAEASAEEEVRGDGPETAADETVEDPPSEHSSEHSERQATLADATVVDLGTWDNPYPAVSVEPTVHWHPHWVPPLLDQHKNAKELPVNYDPEYVRPEQIETLVDYARGDHGQSYQLGFFGGDILQLEIDAEAGRMFWMDVAGSGRVLRASIDGDDDFEVLVTGINQPRGLAVDRKRQQVYWIDMYSNPGEHPHHRNIRRTSYEGGPIEDVVVGLKSPGAVTIDAENGKLYYADRLDPNDIGSSLIVCNLDGSGERLLDITPRMVGSNVTSIALDLRDEKIYWTATAGQIGIRRANLDGSQVEDVVHMGPGGGNDIWAFGLDLDERKIYWAERTYGLVRRANLDGEHILPVESRLSNVGYRPHQLKAAGIETLMGGYNLTPRGFALDLENERMYWTRRMAVERMLIPYLPSTEPQLPPPQITQITPDRQSGGGTVRLTGENFTGTDRVEILEPQTGRRADADYSVNSDSELEITVPHWETEEARLAIVVHTPGGITVTLPQAARTIPYPRHSRVREYRFERFEDPLGDTFWLEERTRLFDVEYSLLFAEANSTLGPGQRGTCSFFLKNGAVLVPYHRVLNSVIYHEPFAIINQEHRLDKTAQQMQVPAIRPSVLPDLLHYQEE